MFGNRVLTLNPLIGLAATPMPAQSTMPASPPPPATTAPAGKTASLPTAKTPVTKLTNLNTAPAEQLDALPEVGKARTKAILNEHAKGKFKDWADVDTKMTATSLDVDAKAKIKDLVTF